MMALRLYIVETGHSEQPSMHFNIGSNSIKMQLVQ